MILQPLPNFKTQFSPKDEVGSYDNIELNQRFVTFTYTWLYIYSVAAAFIISHFGKKKKAIYATIFSCMVTFNTKAYNKS